MANYPNYGSTAPTYSPANYGGDDSRFSQLSDAVGNNIFAINAGSTSLERILKLIGTPKDNSALRDNIHNTQQKTNVSIYRSTDLIKELASLSTSGRKQHKLRTERLENEFKESVKRYSSLQMQLADKIRTAYSFKNVLASEEDESTDRTSLLEAEAKQMMQRQQVISNLEFEQEYAREREDQIHQLEEDILDINQIFRDLGALVHEQGDTINTIEANIDRTYQTVDAGRQELQKASNYQKSYRKKICCFAVIIAIAAVILTIVLVTTLKTKHGP
ncbi:LD27581p [Chamberlinius hualienensis]